MSDNHPQLHGEGALLPLQSGGSSTHSIPGISKIQAAGANGEIQHVIYLAENIGSLYNSTDCSDVMLKVEGVIFPAHRVVLAARSEYFRALLFNGMRETRDSEVELVDTPVNGFRMLLKYIYTGKLSLSSLKEELVLDILGLAHKYGFSELELSISEYFKAILNVRNMCTIYDAAHLYSLRSLSEVCLNFADKHASDILLTQGFLQLSASAVELMIQRDSLCAPEIDIFKAVREWVRQHPEQVEEADMIVSKLRLSLMKLDDLLNVVRPSGLLSSDAILDAIKEQQEKKSVELTYRGFLLPNVNVATTALNAAVLTGEGATALLNGDTSRYDMERGFTTHVISERSPGIVVEFGRPFIINHIRLLLWDRDQRSYHYYIEVSMDKEDWVRVVDHTKYLCRSKQLLYFSPRVVKFVRIVGTHNSVNSSFHLVSMEAMYTTEPFNIDPATTLLIPSANVATIANNATVIEGVSRSRNALLNGETSNYDWDNGYTCHQLGSGAIVVQLPQPYLVDSIRLLLWDCDDRHYSYYIEVSCDQSSWTRVADRTQEQCKAWQILRFERQPVVFIRIVGTHNSANEVFHCVHFECPAQRASLSPFEGSTASTSRAASTSEVVVHGELAGANADRVDPSLGQQAN
ncbi:BTB/POZ domain-containing protein 9 [Toxocara canis]|uniref:BTB/POZ domain-containing protein 9 n=2 Tax=Toxocara canis TaxID=6265 RepID=A0A0B2VAE6_TOXCA|nr:BTB/POZ domain-containing protein 9 [Toxocara canis]VDM40101.1 unnamed protein product [Toxocara canis]